MIRELKQSSLNISKIARKLNLDRKTVRSGPNQNSSPKYIRVPAQSILDNYKDYIQNRLEKYNLTSQKIFEEISPQGYVGKYGMVNQFVR